MMSFLGGTTNQRIDLLGQEGDKPLAASTARGQRDILDGCLQIYLHAPGVKSDPALAKFVREGCAAISANILDRSPSHARARALGLVLAPSLEATDLASAQRAAPYEPWPLYARLAAIGNAAPLAPEVAAVAKTDFATALRSHWGRVEMAKIYTTRADLRGLVQDLLASAPQEVQRDFVWQTRRILKDSG